MEYEALLDAVRSLPAEDQRRLVDVIQTELATHADLTPEQITEVQRRIAGHDADPSSAIPWANVEADIEQQLKELRE